MNYSRILKLNQFILRVFQIFILELYDDIGERMIGDIDFYAVPEEN